ncbi:MAG: hypothetical protein LUE27_00190 [Clostridia bacterium]|nr:hypothetical protein [Clostridia bacterium]
MTNLLTPQALWEKFDDTLPLNSASELQDEDPDVRIEKVTFDGRDTGQGRVRVYAKFATSPRGLKNCTVLLLPDAGRGIEDDLLRMFVSRGCNVLMMDYRGEQDGLLPAWNKPAPKIVRRKVIREPEPVPVKDEEPAKAPAEEPAEEPAEAPVEEIAEGAEASAAESTAAEAEGIVLESTDAEAEGTALEGTPAEESPAEDGSTQITLDEVQDGETAEDSAEQAEGTEEEPAMQAENTDTEGAAEADPEPAEGKDDSSVMEDAAQKEAHAEAPAEQDETPVDADADSARTEAKSLETIKAELKQKAIQDLASLVDSLDAMPAEDTDADAVGQETEDTLEDPVSYKPTEEEELLTEELAESEDLDIEAEAESAELAGDAPGKDTEPAEQTEEQTEDQEEKPAEDAEPSDKSTENADESSDEDAPADETDVEGTDVDYEAPPEKDPDEQIRMDLDFAFGEALGAVEDSSLEKQAEDSAEPEEEPLVEEIEELVEEPLPPHPGEYYTVYPENVKYANYAVCKNNLCFADNGADKTCWYEWAAAGLYARKYIQERTGNDAIAVVGIREGGEVIWKMAVARQFRCAVSICAAGWKSATGLKYEKLTASDARAASIAAAAAANRKKTGRWDRKEKEKEKEKEEEAKPAVTSGLDDDYFVRYNFMASLDSQSYAPHVKCPVYILCSVNDPRFDYDRAYDTYLRINPRYLNDSGITYSMDYGSFIDSMSAENMFMFLNKHLKGHHVFLPRPATLVVDVDRDQNLFARVGTDPEGVVTEIKAYFAEDTLNPIYREWIPAKPVKGKKDEFFLNVYEGTKDLFVIGSVRYFNGFVSWTKVNVKMISGRFRNMQPHCPLVYSGKRQDGGFYKVGMEKYALGGVFLDRPVKADKVLKNGVAGVYASGGARTVRLGKPRYAPGRTSIMSLDIYVDDDSNIFLTITDLKTGKDYLFTDYIRGGYWQSMVLSPGTFKCGRDPLPAFVGETKLTINADCGFAVNNIMWL